MLKQWSVVLTLQATEKVTLSCQQIVTELIYIENFLSPSLPVFTRYNTFTLGHKVKTKKWGTGRAQADMYISRAEISLLASRVLSSPLVLLTSGSTQNNPEVELSRSGRSQTVPLWRGCTTSHEAAIGSQTWRQSCGD